MGKATPGTRPPLISLAMASASALAYQLLLLRLFSIIQWHHFAYMIISLALLGYGASGAFLALARGRLESRLRQAYVLFIALFAASALPAFLLAQQLAFSPEELLWRPALIWRLAGIYLVLGTPFFFVASAVGLALVGWGRQADRVYALDLVGAACGGALALGLLWVADPTDALMAIAAMGAWASVVASFETARARRATGIFAVAMSAALIVTPSPELRLSPYKDLSTALQIAGARVEAIRSSPYGKVTAVANDVVPFREAPGLGLRAVREPPEQVALFVDGDFSSTVTRDPGDRQALSFLEFLPSAVPYAMATPERVLVLEAGGGMLALQARRFGAREILAVERNPDLTDLVRHDLAAFSGGLFGSDSPRLVRAHPRSFLAGDPGGWDLIQLPGTGGLGAGASGLFALSEDYLRTGEAVGLMLDRLAPGGVLAAQSWISLPPRGSLRLVNTLVRALQVRGVKDPAERIMALRSWQMAVILVRNGRFSAPEVSALVDFAAANGYDPAWYPGMTREQANRVHRMDEPWLYDAIEAAVSGRGSEFAANYKFDIRPTTDHRPFFNNFLRWRTVPEAAGLLRSGGMPLLEAGYVLLLATLGQALLLGAVLIVVPMAMGGTRLTLRESPRRAARTLVYFGAIGLAFMFIELAAIHRFILFLEEPIVASAIVVSSFLVFAGAGSLAVGPLSRRGGARRVARSAAVAVVILGVGWLAILAPVTASGAAFGIGIKVVLAVAFIGPLAFAMGQLFPAALSALSRAAPAFVPWAWAVNGCASVIGAVLATVLAVAVGFDGCLLAALGLYLVTITCFPAPEVTPADVRAADPDRTLGAGQQ